MTDFERHCFMNTCIQITSKSFELCSFEHYIVFQRNTYSDRSVSIGNQEDRGNLVK